MEICEQNEGQMQQDSDFLTACVLQNTDQILDGSLYDQSTGQFQDEMFYTSALELQTPDQMPIDYAMMHVPQASASREYRATTLNPQRVSLH